MRDSFDANANACLRYVRSEVVELVHMSRSDRVTHKTVPFVSDTDISDPTGLSEVWKHVTNCYVF